MNENREICRLGVVYFIMVIYQKGKGVFFVYIHTMKNVFLDRQIRENRLERANYDLDSIANCHSFGFYFIPGMQTSIQNQTMEL